MILADSPVIEIAAGTVNDSTAQEVYRNLQVLYGTHTGEQALACFLGVQAGHMGAAIFEQRRHNGLGGLFALQFPPLVVFPDGKFAGFCLAEEPFLQFRHITAAAGAFAHHFAGRREQVLSPLDDLIGSHQFFQHGGDPAHEVLRGQFAAFDLA